MDKKEYFHYKIENIIEDRTTYNWIVETSMFYHKPQNPLYPFSFSSTHSYSIYKLISLITSSLVAQYIYTDIHNYFSYHILRKTFLFYK